MSQNVKQNIQLKILLSLTPFLPLLSFDNRKKGFVEKANVACVEMMKLSNSVFSNISQ